MKLHEIAPNILILTHVDLKIYRLGQDAGVVIGSLFHRHGYPQEIEALSTPEQAEIIETCGRLLIQRYWGRYIALIRSEEHTSELQSLMRISYAVFCLKKKKIQTQTAIKVLTVITEHVLPVHNK